MERINRHLERSNKPSSLTDVGPKINADAHLLPEADSRLGLGAAVGSHDSRFAASSVSRVSQLPHGNSEFCPSLGLLAPCLDGGANGSLEERGKLNKEMEGAHLRVLPGDDLHGMSRSVFAAQSSAAVVRGLAEDETDFEIMMADDDLYGNMLPS